MEKSALGLDNFKRSLPPSELFKDGMNQYYSQTQVKVTHCCNCLLARHTNEDRYFCEATQHRYVVWGHETPGSYCYQEIAKLAIDDRGSGRGQRVTALV